MNNSLQNIETHLGGTQTKAKRNKTVSNNFIRKRTPPKMTEQTQRELTLKKKLQFEASTRKLPQREVIKVENYDLKTMSIKEKKRYFFHC